MKAARILILMALLTVLARAGAPARHRIATPNGVKILWQVPLVRQSTNYSCGAAALKSALAYYGVDLTEEAIMREASTTPQNGTEIEPMAAAAEKHGVKAVARTGVTLQDLEKQVAAGQLTIVTMQAYRGDNQLDKPWAEVWDSGHYLVVIGIDADNVYFVDPVIAGHRGYIPRSEFVERWHDTSLTIGNMQAPAILLNGRPQPTVWEQIP